LAPSGAGLLKVKVFWRQKARVVLRLKISGMIDAEKSFIAWTARVNVIKHFSLYCQSNQ
jgi:hypothetical protein